MKEFCPTCEPLPGKVQTAGKKNTRFVILFPQQFIFFKMKRSFLANSRPTSLIVFHVLFGYKRKNNKEKWPTS